MGGRLFRGQIVDSDDTGKLQTVTILGQYGETIKRVHRVQPFGFHSNMPAKSHGFGVQFGGQDGGRTLKAFLGGEDPDHRPTKRDVGTSALYDANGNIVSLVSRELRVTGKHATVVEGAEKTTVQVGDLKIVVRKGRIDLGAEGGTHAVMTQAGPSSVVFAKI
ncbi:phage baseplate assembly protein [uncultured Methylobacterium sp.]|uniref:phage baseplate assembly protein domain-containing protein n=1 Tax=uncultured Methylobacterium sp. TaxID=157278 RepID=UPI0035CB9129